MNKCISTQIKGVAILMMIWLHCFSSTQGGVYYDFLIFGEQFSHFLTRATNPVEFFIILSGYGLYCLFQSKHKIDVWKRALHLYCLFLISFIIFVSIGCLIKPNIYPGGIIEFIQNITTWHTTYNHTWWFLFPYLVTLLLSNWIFRFLHKNSIITVSIAAIIYITCYFISWMQYHNYISISFWCHQFIKTLDFFLPFIIGACIAKYNIIERINARIGQKKFIFIIALVILLILRLSTDFDFGIQLLYAIVFIIIYALIPQNRYISIFLEHMGKHSATMWFTHAFFIWYLFNDYFYALRYPILIFWATIGASYSIALPIDALYRKLIKMK